MRAVMKYCMRDDKTWDEFSQRYLVSGVNCSGVDSIVEFEATKAAFQKNGRHKFLSVCAVLLSKRKHHAEPGP